MRALNVLGTAIGTGVLMIAVFVGGLYWNVSNPGRGEPLSLPDRATGVGSPEGRAWIATARASDLAALEKAFEPQEKGSWCGVASAVAVLNAPGLGPPVTQEGLFTPEAEAVRSWWGVTFDGMSLHHLAGLLQVHGAKAVATPADTSSEQAFREALVRNAGEAGDYLLVNYDRNALDEAGGGHISPIGAYAPTVDQALILDTASYKYPAHWVPVADLYAAMNTVDGSSGTSRGWVEVWPGAAAP